MDFKVLDSPLDTLAFNYVSVGFFNLVHNLWTWMAVLTAAVSFWSIRIRAAPSAAAAISPLKSDPPLLQDRETETSTTPTALADDPAPSTVPAMATVWAVRDGEGVRTKGKFRVYYENDRESKDEEALAETWSSLDGDAAGGWNEWWEGVMKTRMGELGWYSRQDRTVLNGSVVRLWDWSGGSGDVPPQGVLVVCGVGI